MWCLRAFVYFFVAAVRFGRFGYLPSSPNDGVSVVRGPIPTRCWSAYVNIGAEARASICMRHEEETVEEEGIE